MSKLVLLARAKINLALHIVGQAHDGYHRLNSLVSFADFGDLITIKSAKAFDISLTGPFAAGLPRNADNLIYQVAHYFGYPNVHITLEKNLPIGAGIGGGSADAAAVFRGLVQITKKPLPSHDYLKAMGADIPVCLYDSSAYMSGVGEVIKPITHAPFEAVLVNPNLTLSTKRVFSRLVEKNNADIPYQTDYDFAAISAMRNDLDNVACALVPEITEIKAELMKQRARLVRMSGSGATCFGLFDDKASAMAAGEAIKAHAPHWWVRQVRLG